MNKRKETVAKILELLDGLTYNNSRQILDDVAIKLGEVKITTSSTENGATAHAAEKFLDELTNEISARQAAVLLKILGSSSQVESLADSILEKVQRGSSQATL